MPSPYDPGPLPEDEPGPCAVGQELIKLFPPLESVFKRLAKTPSFMRIFRPVKALVVGAGS